MPIESCETYLNTGECWLEFVYSEEKYKLKAIKKACENDLNPELVKRIISNLNVCSKETQHEIMLILLSKQNVVNSALFEHVDTRHTLINMLTIPDFIKDWPPNAIVFYTSRLLQDETLHPQYLSNADNEALADLLLKLKEISPLLKEKLIDAYGKAPSNPTMNLSTRAQNSANAKQPARILNKLIHSPRLTWSFPPRKALDQTEDALSSSPRRRQSFLMRL